MNTRLSSTRVAALAAFVFSGTLISNTASAETSIAKGDGWEIFLNGRVNIFHSYARGDAYPNRKFSSAEPGAIVLHDVKGGGLDTGNAAAIRPPTPPGSQQLAPGTIESHRLRSGFSSNQFGFGIRRQLSEGTTVTAYMSIWAIVESEARRKYFPVPADVREGYIKFEGAWGTLLAGRALTLFSRGASEITFMYGHGFALGWPGSLDVSGPGAGHIGFGVLGAGFAAGVSYATPRIAGFQLTVGYYDPASLPGASFERTNLPRPEAELTWGMALGNIGRIHLFGNGAWQKVYQKDSTINATVSGFGYGGRLEVGPVHLGIAGHYGRGLGLYYALQPDTAATTSEDGKELRLFDGYFGQLKLVLGKVDIGAGVGITRVYQLRNDKLDLGRDDDNNPDTPVVDDDATPGVPDESNNSYIKSQMGMSGVFVYHINSYLAFAVDYFRADFRWWLGERQLVHVFNSGITMLW